LDLANWRAVVAPPGISSAEQEELIERLTKMASSAEWRSTLSQNGWDDQFLTGPALRQFLLAEQARIEDVMRRLSATNDRSPAQLAVTLTASTLPNAIAMMFLGALALTMFSVSRQSINFNRHGMRMAAAIAAMLLLLPLIFVTLGFVASSTLMFAVASAALRVQTINARSIVADVIVGAVFSITLFLLFTRGLGVALPGF
jgi:hypothetical protein